MVLLRTLMLAGTSNDKHLIQNDVETHALARSTVGFAMWREVRSVFVSVRNRFSAGKIVPMRIGFINSCT